MDISEILSAEFTELDFGIPFSKLTGALAIQELDVIVAVRAKLFRLPSIKRIAVYWSFGLDCIPRTQMLKASSIASSKSVSLSPSKSNLSGVVAAPS